MTIGLAVKIGLIQLWPYPTTNNEKFKAWLATSNHFLLRQCSVFCQKYLVPLPCCRRRRRRLCVSMTAAFGEKPQNNGEWLELFSLLISHAY